MNVSISLYAKMNRASPKPDLVFTRDAGPQLFFRSWQRWLLGVSRVRKTNEFDHLCLMTRDGWIENCDILPLLSAFSKHYEHCWQSGIKEFAQQYHLFTQIFAAAATYPVYRRIYISGLT